MPENNTKHLTVNGMMCPHCEKHVKTALEKIDGIETAIADHTNNSVIITCSKDVDLQQIKAAVTDAGYEFVDMK